MKLTKNERMRRHFAAGGCGLSHFEIADMFGISTANASRLITHLEYSSKKWQVTIERRPQRVITNLVLRDTPEEQMRQQVRAAILANPKANDNSLKEKIGCSITLVRTVRRHMIAAGEAVAVDGRKQQSEQAQIVAPGRRWPDEEPHLAEFVRFREIWPMRVSP